MLPCKGRETNGSSLQLCFLLCELRVGCCQLLLGTQEGGRLNLRVSSIIEAPLCRWCQVYSRVLPLTERTAGGSGWMTSLCVLRKWSAKKTVLRSEIWDSENISCDWRFPIPIQHLRSSSDVQDDAVKRAKYHSPLNYYRLKRLKIHCF